MSNVINRPVFAIAFRRTGDKHYTQPSSPLSVTASLIERGINEYGYAKVYVAKDWAFNFWYVRESKTFAVMYCELGNSGTFESLCITADTAFEALKLVTTLYLSEQVISAVADM